MQVVWKSTTRVGCAVQDCSRNKRGTQGGTIIVCHYSPSGNVPGKYADNVARVLRGSSQPPPTAVLDLFEILFSPDCLVSADTRFTFCMQVRLGALGLMTHFADENLLYTSGQQHIHEAGVHECALCMLAVCFCPRMNAFCFNDSAATACYASGLTN
jgi:hypothetical protein